MAGFRTLIETDEYTCQLADIVDRYSVEAIEPTLRGLLWGIAVNPERYDKLIGSWHIAKSRSYSAAIPSLVIYFEIKNQDEVLLLFIEEMSSFEETFGGQGGIEQ